MNFPSFDETSKSIKTPFFKIEPKIIENNVVNLIYFSEQLIKDSTITINNYQLIPLNNDNYLTLFACKLIDIMKIRNISLEPLNFYLDLRKFGTVPHGGFGLGLDRLCMLFTGIENIKDVVPFPVHYQNCKY
jgi:hypothetical protein